MWPSLKHVLGDLDSIMILHDSTWFPKTYLPSATPTFSVIYFCHFFSTFVIFNMIITPTRINVNGSLCESDIGKVPPYNSTTRGFLVFLVFSTINIICVRNFTWFDYGSECPQSGRIYVILCWDLNDVTLILGKFPHSPYNSTTRPEWASRFPPDHHHHRHHCLFYLSFETSEQYSTNWCHRLDKSW